MNKPKRKKSSLAEIYPELIRFWDMEKNGEKTPYNMTIGSKEMIWLLCENSHGWQEKINNFRRRKISNCCKECSSFIFKFPELAKELHPSKNNHLQLHDIPPGSSTKLYFVCPVGHEYKAQVNNRAWNGSGCPVCTGKILDLAKSLQVTHPNIYAQIHPEKNINIDLINISPHSKDELVWLCSKEHEWKERICNRAKRLEANCKICDSFAFLKPELLEGWSPENKINPYETSSTSGKRGIWICKRCKHKWTSIISNRYNGSGCPGCSKGWTIEKIRSFIASLLPRIDSLNEAELYVFFQQTGLLDIDRTSKGKFFVQALKTGKFPKDELEKFVNGQPSLVDEIISNRAELAELQNDNLLAPENTIVEIEANYKNEPYIVEAKDVLATINSPLFANLDKEVIDFFIHSAVAKLWKHAFKNEVEVRQQLEQFTDQGLYSQEVKKLFLQDYNGAKGLEVPAEYSFPEQPNLMQMYTAYLIKTRKRIGNWSGTGAGKTRSAVLASRLIHAKITVICCPNNVIGNWEENITKITIESMVHIKKLPRSIDYTKSQYIILNYEFFSQPQAENKLRSFLDEHSIDFMIIDEIHFAKQREENKASARKKIIASFLSQASANNENLHVLGMSATPVLNNLLEARTLIELITGVYHSDLPVKATVPNCITMYQKMITHGIRWVPNYDNQLNIEKKEIDCSEFITEIRENNLSGSYVDLEVILTKAKIPLILANLKRKTIIYTHYHRDNHIVYMLRDAIEQESWRVALFIGDTKDNLETFIKGDADVLIASSCIATGIDGLQTVCDRLIINSLPWTHAELQQLVGRIYRQGQASHKVDIIIPITYATINEKKWSYCESRWNRIEFKRSIADAAVDGIIPVGHLRTPQQAYKDIMQWLERLDRGEVHEIERQKVQLLLSGTSMPKALRKIGDLSLMNQKINCETSQQTNQHFLSNPSEWYDYHAVYSEARNDWEVIPYQEAIKWCTDRPDYIVGDFGCGEAFLVKELANRVYSFDHVAINDKVIACDMSNVPLNDASLDVAVFSLSLMGINFVDYLKEARRCLKLDGHLWIAEPTLRIKHEDSFKELLERIGFYVLYIKKKGKFTFIEALKSGKEINEEMVKVLMEQQLFV